MKTFKTREDIRAWLETQTRDVCVVIAARASLRVLPIHFLEFSDVNEHTIDIFCALFSALHYSTDDNKTEKRGMFQYDGVGTAAASAAAAASVSTAAYPAISASAASFPYTPSTSTSIAADFYLMRTKYFKAISSDANFLGSNNKPEELLLQPLWLKKTDLSKRLIDTWKNYSAKLLSLDQDWEVWIDWYNDRLEGTPFNPKLEFGQISFPDEDYKDPAVINAKIKALLALGSPKAIADATPLGEDILLNEDGKFYAKFRPVEDIYEDNLSNLKNALDLVLKENAFNDTSAVIKILNDTITKYFLDPQRIHDNCHFALNRIQTLLEDDVIAESDGIAFLKHVLNLNIVDVRSHDSKVKDVFEKRSNLLLDPDAVDINEIDAKQIESVLEVITTEDFFQENVEDILTIKGFDGNQKDAIYRILSRFSRMFIYIKQLGVDKTGKIASSLSINESAKVTLLEAQPYLQSVIDILRPFLSGI